MNNKVKMKVKDQVQEFLSKPSLIFTYFGIAAVVFVTTSLITWLSTYFQVTRGLAQDKAGTLSSAVMVLAIVGAPVGGIITDHWRKTNIKARLLFPAITSVLSAIFLFAALNISSNGTIQYILFLLMGVTITAFISAAAAVTQDVVHPGFACYVVCNCSCCPEPSGSLYGTCSDWENIRSYKHQDSIHSTSFYSADSCSLVLYRFEILYKRP